MGQNGFNQSIEVKLVAAGDGCVGKTCLLMCYAYNRFPTEYLPTVFDTYTVDVVVDGHSINRKFLLPIIIEILSDLSDGVIRIF